MTVSELIKELQKRDGRTEVHVMDWNLYTAVPIGSIDDDECGVILYPK